MIQSVCMDISQIDAEEYNHLYAQASAQRQNRANRYPCREDKLRCVAADALLRYAVRQRLNLSDFTVVQDSFGKPSIQGQQDFHYNIAHSGRWVVVAYGDSRVGIDVQQIRMDPDKRYLAHRCFTREEEAYIFDADESEQARRFIQVWTAKESYLKYLGIGLRRPLNSFSVVPDGSHLGVRFRSIFTDGYCMTLCTQDPHSSRPCLYNAKLGLTDDNIFPEHQ